MALDNEGRVYVGGYPGSVISYTPDGKLYWRWKVLTPEMEKTWLKPDGQIDLRFVRVTKYSEPKIYLSLTTDAEQAISDIGLNPSGVRNGMKDRILAVFNEHCGLRARFGPTVRT
jgi:hypothetical protein